jgi:hemerythrin
MTKFIWLEEYRTGDDTIDRQHKYLFDLANQIIDPLNDIQKTYHNFLTLNHYITEHFKVEESLMKQCGDPDYHEHVKEHNAFAQKLPEISMSIISGAISLAKVTDFINRWYFEHFLEKDVLLTNLLHHKNQHK